MTSPKAFGQIAYETYEDDINKFPWSDLYEGNKAQWQRVAASIALECSRICTEIAAEHMRHAQGGDNTGASDYRQQAALECSSAILEAIS